jgi:hypothetical protein
MFLVLNPRLERNLVIFALYLGLVDGYLKLSTGSNLAPVARDVLLYSIVIGALLRLAISDQKVRLPKYTAHVALFVALVLAQTLNPATPGAKAALGGLRQHLEFVPLFFLGYVCMRTEKRLRAFLILLLVVAALNAIVAAVQYNLSPEALASWGPGYSERILGTGAFEGAARTFSDAAGASRVRPFGLGSDLGAAGVVGWSSIGAALALIALPRAPRLRIAGAIGLIFCVLAVLSAQSKAVVFIAVLVPIAFAALTVTSREATRGVVTLLVGGLLIYATVTVFLGENEGTGGSRLAGLGSGQLQSTIAQERGNSAKLIPTYAARYPLGNGLGRAGPAAGFGGGGSTLNAENEPNFLIGELGTLGLLVVLTLWVRVLVDGVRAVRRTTDTRVRLFLAALMAALLGCALSWLASTPTVSTPAGPLFWFVAGVIAWTASRRAPGFINADQTVADSPAPRPVLT